MQKSGGLLSALLCVVLAIGGCRHQEKPEEKSATLVGAAEVVSHTPGDRSLRYSGNVEADKQVQVAIRVGGYVDSIMQVRDGRLIQKGDRVSRGAVLARVRQADYTTKVDQAISQVEAGRAAVSQAESQYNQAQATQDGARAQMAEARAALAPARSQLAEVQAAKLQAESMLAEAQAAKRQAESIASTSPVKVVFGVPDMEVPNLQIGQSLRIATDALPGRYFTGRIIAIAPAADVASRVFKVEVTVPNAKDRLKIGMIATLELPDPGEALR